MSTPLKIAKVLKVTAGILLFAIGLATFNFAMLSGSEEYGGGLEGIMKNLPNALPWAALIIVNFIAWKRELIGGIALMLMGGFMVFFFNSGENFYPIVFALTMAIPALGSLFVFSWMIRKKHMA